MQPSFKQVKLAEAAIVLGRTRGQFIRENTDETADIETYQSWSDAYTYATHNLQREPSLERVTLESPVRRGMTGAGLEG